MITINNKQYRNLEETVRYLTEQYNANQGIAEWGIRILGVLTSAEELPDPATYVGEYGDAYAVGAEPPYNFYIWTRSAVVDTAGFWFDFGDIAIAGPQGPAGESIVGPAGERGSLWYVKTGQPNTTSGYNIGDCWLNPATGNVWHLHDVEGTPTWLLEGNIRGPQGIGVQGPKGNPFTYADFTPEQLDSLKVVGPQGPVGPAVSVMGYIDSIDQLPNPTTVPHNSAYLQTVNGATNIWIIVGDVGEETWRNAGVFSGGTIVYQGGSPVDTFDADTKLNKRGVALQLYCNNSLNEPSTVSYGTAITNGLVVQRTGTGQINVPQAPADEYHAASKAYVDKRVPFPTQSFNVNTVQFVPAGRIGQASTIGMTSTVEPNRIVQRLANANIPVHANVSTEMDYAIGAKQVATMLSAITPATITGQNVPANGTLQDAIGQDETGFFVIVGASRLNYTLNNTPTEIQSEYHLIFKYYETNTGVYRMVHIYFQAPSLSDLTVIKRADGALSGNITVNNLQTGSGARVIKLPMASPTT